MLKVQLVIWTDSITPKETEKEYAYVLASRRGWQYGDGICTGTFNRVVLTAIIEALNRIEENAEVLIFTENRFVLSMAAHHLKTWEQNEFKTTKGATVKNEDLWRKIAMKKRSLKLVGKPVGANHRDWLRDITEDKLMLGGKENR